MAYNSARALTGDGGRIFRHACGLGLDAIVSKRIGSRCVTRAWLKTKNRILSAGKALLAFAVAFGLFSAFKAEAPSASGESMRVSRES